MRSPALCTNGFYHVYNHSVGQRPLFANKRDYYEFLEYLYLFSDANFKNPDGDFMLKAIPLAGHEVFSVERDPLVKILSFNLRSNHFHLFLEQLKDNGISILLHKLQRTYSFRSNKRRGEFGTLFEPKFKAKLIDNQAYNTHLPRYIHLNSLDPHMPRWRIDGIQNWDEAFKILENDPWSSHHVYMGRAQELPIVDEKFVHSLFGSNDEYLEFLREPIQPYETIL